MEASTKDRLLDAGLALLLQRGYNHLGIQDVLAETRVPKGSFYHHFESKEDFGLQVIERYMVNVHGGLGQFLGDKTVPPLRRVRNFFEATRDSYGREGYLGCLLGGLGQELAGISNTFRDRVEQCFREIARQISACLEEAIVKGDLPRGTDAQALANLLVDCWEGAALRTRLLRDPAPLMAMLDFYFRSAAAATPRRAPARSPRRAQRRPSTRASASTRVAKRARRRALPPGVRRVLAL